MAFNSPRGGRVTLDDISFSSQFCTTDTGELQIKPLILSPLMSPVK